MIIIQLRYESSFCISHVGFPFIIMQYNRFKLRDISQVLEKDY